MPPENTILYLTSGEKKNHTKKGKELYAYAQRQKSVTIGGSWNSVFSKKGKKEKGKRNRKGESAILCSKGGSMNVNGSNPEKGKGGKKGSNNKSGDLLGLRGKGWRRGGTFMSTASCQEGGERRKEEKKNLCSAVA